ncbi:MAG: pilus assembly protein TadE [Burkholderiales bacterium]|nr:pilus assembly protein TadE [Burkholderiales bacterium]
MRTHSISERAHVRQRASAGMLSALMAAALLSAGAMALDFGKVWALHGELQNAADAAALAGAGALGPAYPRPDWLRARTLATLAVSLNSTAAPKLAVERIQTGYWNIAQPRASLRPNGITPGANDRPAVMVTVSHAPTDQSGVPGRLLASLLAMAHIPVSATAVAVIAVADHAAAGTVFPLAIPACLYDAYWDSANARPRNNPATGRPFILKIGAAYRHGACPSGQWTSFETDAQSASQLRELIASGNPTGISTGDSIWIQPGASAPGNAVPSAPQDLLLPVVASLDGHRAAPIVAFAPFRLTGPATHGGQYIEGHFMAADSARPRASGDALASPALVR